MAVAVLGLGSIGLRHARNLLTLEQTVVGFDPAPDRRAALVEAGGTAVETRDAAIEAAAAVVVASPNAHHLEDMAAAVDAGCHVFVEKPLAHTVDGVKGVLERAARADRVVFAGLNQRFNPAVREARALIADGRLGSVLWGRFLTALYLPDWRPWQDHRKGYAADPATGGVIFDAVHEFDLAHHLLGRARTLAATARSSGSLEIPSDDVADILWAIPGASSPACTWTTSPGRRAASSISPARRGCSTSTCWGGAWSSTTGMERRFWNGPTTPHSMTITATKWPPSWTASRRDREPACDGREALDVLRQVIAARSLAGLPGAARGDTPKGDTP